MVSETFKNFVLSIAYLLLKCKRKRFRDTFSREIQHAYQEPRSVETPDKPDDFGREQEIPSTVAPKRCQPRMIMMTKR